MRVVLIASLVLMLTSVSAAPTRADGYDQVAIDACAYYGCSGAWLVSIMNCESGQNPDAWHPNPNGGSDLGIMQINDQTWGSIAYAGPVDQIWWSAEKLSEGRSDLWLCA